VLTPEARAGVAPRGPASLRVSVTERCDLMSLLPDRADSLASDGMLPPPGRLAIAVRWVIRLAATRVKITGQPLFRKGVVEFVPTFRARRRRRGVDDTTARDSPFWRPRKGGARA
jgi:molybdenum cofactor biosynthesis enzyme MoaA